MKFSSEVCKKHLDASVSLFYWTQQPSFTPQWLTTKPPVTAHEAMCRLCGHLRGPQVFLPGTGLFSWIPGHSRVFYGDPRHVLGSPCGLPAGLWNYLWPVLYMYMYMVQNGLAKLHTFNVYFMCIHVVSTRTIMHVVSQRTRIATSSVLALGRVRTIDFGYGYGRWQSAHQQWSIRQTRWSSHSRSQSRQFRHGLSAPLTSSHRRPYKHAISFGTADRRASKCALRFLCVLAGALSTRHAWRAIVALDLYTRQSFSKSMGSQFDGPGQKALQAMNEFTLLWIFA